jgi:hypothetical protein
LYIVFSNLWAFIVKHKHSTELKIRLLEEIIEMSMYCSSGHLSRFMNVIQGYTDIDDLCIHISQEAQIDSVIFMKMNSILKDAPDTVMDSMISDQPDIFIDFIVTHINMEMPKLIQEYGNVYDIILMSITNYTKYKNFIIEKGKLVNKINEEI